MTVQEALPVQQKRLSQWSDTFSTRHGRACPGHPRLRRYNALNVDRNTWPWVPACAGTNGGEALGSKGTWSVRQRAEAQRLGSAQRDHVALAPPVGDLRERLDELIVRAHALGRALLLGCPAGEDRQRVAGDHHLRLHGVAPGLDRGLALRTN